MKRPTVLIVDDEPSIRRMLMLALVDEGYSVHEAASGRSAIECAREIHPNLVLLDISMPGDIDGVQTLPLLRELIPCPQVVMMSGHGTIETAVKATKLGAWDFLEKPLSLDRVNITIQNSLRFQAELSAKRALLGKILDDLQIIGVSSAARLLKTAMHQASQSPDPLLLVGERGSGRRLLAKNLHFLSARASHPFIHVSCRSIPPELLLSQIFGVHGGSDGRSGTQGFFELAKDGTLVLSDIEELSDEQLRVILTAINQSEYLRVGGDCVIPLTTRVILAGISQTFENLGNLDIRRIKLVPLRERKEDIEHLVDHFSKYQSVVLGGPLKKFTKDSLNLLSEHSWPGNIQELKNFIERVYILIPEESVTPDDLRFCGLTTKSPSLDPWPTFREARAAFERSFIERKIAENRGNVAKTAESIGLDRSHLSRKMKLYGIDL